jgi:hypothetical protein
MKNWVARHIKMIPEDDAEEPVGPWQEPVDLWRAAHGIYRALDKEGYNLLGQEIFFREITPGELDYWKGNLEDDITFCKFAHENKKRVRFIIY